MRAKALLQRRKDDPFRPFRVHVSDGSTIAVTEPGNVIVGSSGAVLPTEHGMEDGERVITRWRTVALSHLVQFSDIDKPVSGKRPRKRA